jgi:hypothetical protein
MVDKKRRREFITLLGGAARALSIQKSGAPSGGSNNLAILAPQFRTIQVCPKDLPAPLRQAEMRQAELKCEEFNSS